MASYQIMDEPTASGLSRYAVNPLWVLLGSMLGGAWLAWLWFAFNAAAVGSATRVKEWALCVLGFAGSIALTWVLVETYRRGLIGPDSVPYAGTVLLVWKLGMGFWLQVVQTPSYELFAYFRSANRYGVFVALAAMLVGKRVTGAVGSDFWALVLS